MSELRKDMEVELAPGFDHLYNPKPAQGMARGAFVGARAVIRDRKPDEVGFPQVYIEWKKDDWRYAGMPDGWTYENHFRPVKEESRHESDGALSEMIRQAQAQRECPHCGEVHDPEADVMDDYLEEVREAQDDLLGSDAFMIVTVKQGESPTPDVAKFDGRIFNAEMSREAREALEQQIIQIAAHLLVNRGGQ